MSLMFFTQGRIVYKLGNAVSCTQLALFLRDVGQERVLGVLAFYRMSGNTTGEMKRDDCLAGQDFLIRPAGPIF